MKNGYCSFRFGHTKIDKEKEQARRAARLKQAFANCHGAPCSEQEAERKAAEYLEDKPLKLTQKGAQK